MAGVQGSRLEIKWGIKEAKLGGIIMGEIPKLIMTSRIGIVACPNCTFISNRYDSWGHNSLGVECPYCRLKERLKKLKFEV